MNSSGVRADHPDHPAIRGAADRLAAGELVAFPTETVYGLGARADSDSAVQRIFEAKGRPSEHPLIVHVTDAEAADAFAESLSPVAQRLMSAFWPGPLTVIVPRRPGVAAACAGGQDSIGLRCPSHPMAQALLRACAQRGVAGVAAPSANRFGRVSPTRASHVRSEFGLGLMVLDGGPCEVGIESAIVDCTRPWPVLLRPGCLTRAQLEAVAGQPLRDPDSQAPRASGTLESHYAPQARVRLIPCAELLTAAREAAAAALTVALYSPEPGEPRGGIERPVQPEGRDLDPLSDRPGPWPALWRRMPTDAAEAARDLFAALRELDDGLAALGGGQIWVQSPPADAAWDGVRDRLRRAAA